MENVREEIETTLTDTQLQESDMHAANASVIDDNTMPGEGALADDIHREYEVYDEYAAGCNTLRGTWQLHKWATPSGGHMKRAAQEAKRADRRRGGGPQSRFIRTPMSL